MHRRGLPVSWQATTARPSPAPPRRCARQGAAAGAPRHRLRIRRSSYRAGSWGQRAAPGPERDAGGDAASTEQPAQRQRRDDGDDGRSLPASPTAAPAHRGGRVSCRRQRLDQDITLAMAGQKPPAAACAVAAVSDVGGEGAVRSRTASGVLMGLAQARPNPSVAGSARPTASSSPRDSACATAVSFSPRSAWVNSGTSTVPMATPTMPSGSSISRVGRNTATIPTLRWRRRG